ncbi:hypothetical protein GCM10022403_080100 [Streptomyces coacervatus]|uniref:Uncharacterized protein n=1 Tax=Streptomyces coacervatus TaxID=647381 RepID=A0ABP7J712_9ACTN
MQEVPAAVSDRRIVGAAGGEEVVLAVEAGHSLLGLRTVVVGERYRAVEPAGVLQRLLKALRRR